MSTATTSYLTQTAVKERGWTDWLIRQFLPSPDQTRRNPCYRNAAPMKLYAVDRVVAAEATSEFMEHPAHKRRQSAQRAVETKRQQLSAHLDTIEIQVPVVDNLVDCACQSYNDHNWRSEWAATPDSERSFLDRICVNYLRHRMTSYEYHLDTIAGRVGVADGYIEVKSKVLNAIADAYPNLAGECSRQESSMLQYA